jgi:uncharacterized protein YcsI (UPF0317 family)
MHHNCTTSVSAESTAAQIRAACRSGSWTSPTSGLALGYQQANLVVLPQEYAFDFLLFCHRNPKPCPLLDVTDPGSAEPRRAAAGADLRTDLPRYAVYEQGRRVATPTDLLPWWRGDLVAFLLGCSFTFEAALLCAGLPVRHLEQGVNVPMFKTNLPNQKAGRFQGELVVSMRPFPAEVVDQAARLSARMPCAHGAPVHIGDPRQLGIADLQRPDFGDAVQLHAGDVPVFWACGVTPQVAIMAAQPSLALTHLPGCMFLTDLHDENP